MLQKLAMFLFILACYLVVTSSAQEIPTESVKVCRDRTDVTSYAPTSGVSLLSFGPRIIEWVGCLWNTRCTACPWYPGHPWCYEPPLYASITNHHSYISQVVTFGESIADVQSISGVAASCVVSLPWLTVVNGFNAIKCSYLMSTKLGINV